MNEMRKLMEAVNTINEQAEYEVFSIKFMYDRENDPYNINWEVLDAQGNFDGSGSDSLEDMPRVLAELILPNPPEDDEIEENNGILPDRDDPSIRNVDEPTDGDAAGWEYWSGGNSPM